VHLDIEFSRWCVRLRSAGTGTHRHGLDVNSGCSTSTTVGIENNQTNKEVTEEMLDLAER
jgi:hypothetical protein